MSSLFGVISSADSLQEQVKDMRGVIARDWLAGDLPRLPVPAKNGISSGIYERLMENMVAPEG